MGQPAARLADPVAHPLPPVLTGGPCSPNVIIGGLPAWRGLPLAAVAGLLAAKQTSDTVIKTAEVATVSAAGTPGAPAAKAAEETVKATAAATMGNLISSLGAMTDIHLCTTPLPISPPRAGSGDRRQRHGAHQQPTRLLFGQHHCRSRGAAE